MELTKEEYEKLTPHLSTIELVVRNQAASHLSIDFLNLINEIAHKYKLSSCQTCSRQLYITITRIYDSYLEYRIKYEKNKKRKNEKKL